MALAFAQRFFGKRTLSRGQPMFRHVHRCADELDQIASIVGDRVARRVLIPDAAVGKDDAIAGPVFRLLVQAALELRLDARTIFRMNPIEPESRLRDVLTRLHAVHALNLGRALDNPRCRVEPPGPRPTELLHFEQMGLAFQQRLLGQLSVVNVYLHAVPAGTAIPLIARPKRPQLEPPVLAIRAPQTVFVFEWLARFERTRERGKFGG